MKLEGPTGIRGASVASWGESGVPGALEDGSEKEGEWGGAGRQS